MTADCEPGAAAFIQRWANDCVYTWKDGTGFALGMLSILLWLTAQLPQFLENIKLQSCEGLSVWFLAQWFVGDTLNLLGCLMQGEQLATTTALAGYFVIADMVMLTQFVYYGAVQKRKEAMRRRLARRLRGSRSMPAGTTHTHHQYQQHHQHAYTDVPPFLTVLSGHQHTPQQQQQTRMSSHQRAASAPIRPIRTSASAAPGRDAAPGHTTVLLPSSPHTTIPPPSGHCKPAGPSRSSSSTVLVAAVLGLASLVSLAALGGGYLHPGEGGLQPVHASLVPAGSAAQLQQAVQVPAWAPADAMVPDVQLHHHRHRRGHSHRRHHDDDTDPTEPDSEDPDAGGDSDSDYGDDDYGPDSWPDWLDADWVRVLGSVFGYGSTCLYLSSRLSQIHKNWARQSAEGLSVVMFLFTISANLCSGSAIVLRVQDREALTAQLPWVLGAFGTVGLDLVIFLQASSYARRHAQLAAGGGTASKQQAGASAATVHAAGDGVHGWQGGRDEAACTLDESGGQCMSDRPRQQHSNPLLQTLL